MKTSPSASHLSTVCHMLHLKCQYYGGGLSYLLLFPFVVLRGVAAPIPANTQSSQKYHCGEQRKSTGG